MTADSPQNPITLAPRDVPKRRGGRILSTTALSLALLFFATSAWASETEVDRLARILQLKPGSSVADVGAGSGDMSIAIAGRVAPGGLVYSTEINSKLLEKIRGAVQAAGVRNVIVVAAREHDTGLPPYCCDAIFLREVYHHLTDPAGTDDSLYTALRPGALLAIVDFEPIAGEPPAPGVPASHGTGHGVLEKIVVQEVSHSGFELVSTMDWPVDNRFKTYLVLFRKPLASPAHRDVSPSRVVGEPRKGPRWH